MLTVGSVVEKIENHFVSQLSDLLKTGSITVVSAQKVVNAFLALPFDDIESVQYHLKSFITEYPYFTPLYTDVLEAEINEKQNAIQEKITAFFKQFTKSVTIRPVTSSQTHVESPHATELHVMDTITHLPLTENERTESINYWKAHLQNISSPHELLKQIHSGDFGQSASRESTTTIPNPPSVIQTPLPDPAPEIPPVVDAQVLLTESSIPEADIVPDHPEAPNIIPSPDTATSPTVVEPTTEVIETPDPPTTIESIPTPAPEIPMGNQKYNATPLPHTLDILAIATINSDADLDDEVREKNVQLYKQSKQLLFSKI